MPEILIKSCGSCPYYHVGEAEIGYKTKRLCTFRRPRDWKKIPEDGVHYKVLDDCPMHKSPIVLTIK